MLTGKRTVDVLVVGGGIVGVATGMALLERARLSLCIVEAEGRLAAHQTGNNSGVIHSGLYYQPGSLKARNCVEGRRALRRFCETHGVPVEVCGKVVVATRPEQLPALDELMRRGVANGLQGLRRLAVGEVLDLEPHAAGCGGLHVPETGIVDYRRVTEAYADVVRSRGGEILTGARVISVARDGEGIVVETSRGDRRARALVNCAGLQSDRVARLCGAEPDVRIVPFRGEYYTLRPEARRLVRNLIYPVPDPEFPFLGVHFTRRIGGEVEAGPNAVLALKREGYGWRDFSARDVLATVGYSGFWRLARRYWRMGLGEMYRSLSKRAFVQALQALLPEITSDDLGPGGAGVRAQALDATGALVDDFRIVAGERMIHVLNAPSPAATASLSIGRSIAEQAIAQFGLQGRPGASA
ncbi:MAG: L-2-hydroxyglutarate oxidase [Deltaproteobacteria bacterium]|nr:L-2-hydroxyglutarate oxidase [Deltaproteobacteria bacterium]